MKKLLCLTKSAGALLLSPVIWVGTARAALGEKAESIGRDLVALRAKSVSVAHFSSYDQHELTTAEGLRIREYIGAGGVFAVTWSGRTQPDLQYVLKDHYSTYAKAAAGHRSGHHVLVASTPDFELRIVKLQREIRGQVRLPALMPVGVDVRELR